MRLSLIHHHAAWLRASGDVVHGVAWCWQAAHGPHCVVMHVWPYASIWVPLGTPSMCANATAARGTACNKNAFGPLALAAIKARAPALRSMYLLLCIFLHLLISCKELLFAPAALNLSTSVRRPPPSLAQGLVAVMEPGGGNDAFYQPTIQQGSMFDAAQYSFFGDLDSGLAGALEVWLTSPSLACRCWCGRADENTIHA